MSESFAMIPPQIQVGTGQHTVQVQQIDCEDFLLVKLVAGTTEFAQREFHTQGEVDDELMPWLADRGGLIGETLDRRQKIELARSGYKV